MRVRVYISDLAGFHIPSFTATSTSSPIPRCFNCMLVTVYYFVVTLDKLFSGYGCFRLMLVVVTSVFVCLPIKHWTGKLIWYLIMECSNIVAMLNVSLFCHGSIIVDGIQVLY